MYNGDIFVQRGSKGTRERLRIAGTIAQSDYVKFFNAVDRNDWDSADYSLTVRTHRFYLRVLFWVIGRVIHICYMTVMLDASIAQGALAASWSLFAKRNGGRRKFQIQLGLDILSYAISNAWDGRGERPDWMRQGPFVPCECDKCYFCLNGHTTGIGHQKKYQKIKVIHTKNMKITRVGRCTNDWLPLGKGSSYCRMCMRKLHLVTGKDGKTLTSIQKRKLCTNSTKGCPQPGCNEHICWSCWDEGYDKHSTLGN